MADDNWGMKVEKIEMNSAGAREVLNAEGVKGLLERLASGIASAAGGDSDAQTDFMYEVHSGGTRARAIVYTATIEAMWLEAHERRLTAAIGRG